MKYLIICLTSLICVNSFAQSILNAASPEEFRKMREEGKEVVGEDTVSIENEPTPYGYVAPKDILWSKVVWEIIDLNEKINQPYYASTNNLESGSKSLYDVLFDGVKSGRIKEVYSDDNFTVRKSNEDIESSIESVRPSDWFLDLLNSGEPISSEDSIAGIDRFKVDSRKVEFIKVKGMWYIDKRLGEMKYRLLGIAPMGPDPQMMGQNIGGGYISDENEMIDMFWIWYPDARKTLSNYTVFNPRNTTASISFDDVLNARRFHSIIYKADSGLGGEGTISDLFPDDAKAQVDESNRLRSSILEQENNLWNY